MELLFLLLPFVIAGFVAAFFSRFTGAAMTMLLAPFVLYLGASPMELLVFMLTFIVYNNFTLETQAVRLKTKELTFFKGWKIAIPLLLTAGLIFVKPFLAMTLFIVAFILELSAAVYYRIPADKRPTVKEVLGLMLSSIMVTMVGVIVSAYVFGPLGFGAVMAPYYYIFVGLGILAYTWFACYAGKHRRAFEGSWNMWLAGLHIFTGLFGIEGSSYYAGLRRTYPSKVDGMMGIIAIGAAFVGMMTLFVLTQQFSMAALVAAIGAAICVRSFGLYEFNNRGGFSYVAIGMIVFVVLCLYLVQPVPQGFVDVEQLFLKP